MQSLSIRREKVKQQVLYDDRQTERDQERRFIPAPYDAIEKRALNTEPDKKHYRHNDCQRKNWIVDDAGKNKAYIARENKEVAVSQICNSHDTEYHAHAEADSGIQTSYQQTLNN